jgi:hypothetical protein
MCRKGFGVMSHIYLGLRRWDKAEGRFNLTSTKDSRKLVGTTSLARGLRVMQSKRGVPRRSVLLGEIGPRSRPLNFLGRSPRRSA